MPLMILFAIFKNDYVPITLNFTNQLRIYQIFHNMKEASYNKQQTQLIKEFRETTQASLKQAKEFLSRSKWNIQNAINLFFDEGAMPELQPLKSTAQIQNLFNQLSSPNEKNPQTRYMDEDRFSQFIERYFKYADDDVVVGHILINIMEVETSGYIELKHFVKLFQHLNLVDPKDLPKYATKLTMELKNDKTAYKSLYTKIYRFYLIGNKDHSLDYSIAEELWRIYLRPIMPLYNKFMEFLALKSKKPNKVHKDLWNMVYEFALTVKDPKEVKEGDAWPVFLDDFVQYCLQGTV